MQSSRFLWRLKHRQSTIGGFQSFKQHSKQIDFEFFSDLSFECPPDLGLLRALCDAEAAAEALFPEEFDPDVANADPNEFAFGNRCSPLIELAYHSADPAALRLLIPRSRVFFSDFSFLEMAVGCFIPVDVISLLAERMALVDLPRARREAAPLAASFLSMANTFADLCAQPAGPRQTQNMIHLLAEMRPLAAGVDAICATGLLPLERVAECLEKAPKELSMPRTQAVLDRAELVGASDFGAQNKPAAPADEPSRSSLRL